MQEAGVEEESDEENQSDAEDNEEFDTVSLLCSLWNNYSYSVW